MEVAEQVVGKFGRGGPALAGGREVAGTFRWPTDGAFNNAGIGGPHRPLHETGTADSTGSWPPTCAARSCA